MIQHDCFSCPFPVSKLELFRRGGVILFVSNWGFGEFIIASYSMLCLVFYDLKSAHNLTFFTS